MPLRVAFILDPLQVLGIRNYLRNLFAAIATLPGVPIVPVLLTGFTYGEVAKELAAVTRLQTSLLDRKRPAWFLRKLVQKLTGRDLLLQRFLWRNGIAVLSHSTGLGVGSRVKSLGWIADLQHRHLPHLFDPTERDSRDRSFARLGATCDAIVLSSACGLQDLREFYPSLAGKGRVLQFRLCRRFRRAGNASR